MPQLFMVTKRSPYAEHTAINKLLDPTHFCTTTQAAAELTRRKRICDTPIYEKLKLRDIQTVTFLNSDHPSNDFVSSVTNRNSSRRPRTKRSSITTISNNIDSGKETGTIQEAPIRFTSPQEPYSMIVRSNEDFTIWGRFL